MPPARHHPPADANSGPVHQISGWMRPTPRRTGGEDWCPVSSTLPAVAGFRPGAAVPLGGLSSSGQKPRRHGDSPLPRCRILLLPGPPPNGSAPVTRILRIRYAPAKSSPTLRGPPMENQGATDPTRANTRPFANPIRRMGAVRSWLEPARLARNSGLAGGLSEGSADFPSGSFHTDKNQGEVIPQSPAPRVVTQGTHHLVHRLLPCGIGQGQGVVET